MNHCCKISLFFLLILRCRCYGGGGHVGNSGENKFVFKYSGIHMETECGGLLTFVHERVPVNPRNVILFG